MNTPRAPKQPPARAFDTLDPSSDAAPEALYDAPTLGEAETLAPEHGRRAEVPQTLAPSEAITRGDRHTVEVAPTLMSAPPTPDDATAPTLPPTSPSRPGFVSKGISIQVPSDGHRPQADQLEEVSDHYYERGDELARGGMGRIILALDHRLKRPVAIKELLDDGERAQIRFEREALITAQMQHPGIVNIYEAGRWPSGEPFYTMEKVNGRPLDEVIDDIDDPATRLALLPHIIGVADAMAYAHTQGVIHRDLKPANVLIGAFGECVVIDWGLAKYLHDKDDEPLSEDDADRNPLASGQGLTIAGSVMGTPGYMPPEQAEGTHVDERADVYALGAMLYHLLAGRPPYQGQNSRQILINLLSGDPQPLTDFAPDVPEELLAIVERAMHRDLDRRYRNANDLADDLRRFQAGKLVAAHSYSAWDLTLRWLKRHRAAVSVVCVALIALTLIGLFSLQEIIKSRHFAEQQRDIASQQRDVAQTQSAIAQQRRVEAEQAHAHTILMRASDALDYDPTEALGYLKSLTLSTDDPLWSAARSIAADAVTRGVDSHVLRGHRGVSHRVLLTPDDQQLLSSSRDGTLRLWSLRGGGAEVFRHPEGLVEEFAVSRDVRFAAVLTQRRKRIALLDLASGELQTLPKLQGATSVAFHPSLPLLAVGLSTGEVWLKDLTSDKQWYENSVQGSIQTLRFSPNGATIVASSDKDGLIQLDLESHKKTGIAAGQKTSVDDVEYSPDGQWGLKVSRAGSDSAPVLFRADDPDQTKDLEDAASGYTSATFSPDNKWLALAYTDKILMVSLYDEQPSWTLASGGVIERFKFSSSGRHLAASVRGGGIKIWDLDRPRGFELKRDFSEGVVFVFSERTETIVVTQSDNTIRLRNLARDNKKIKSLSATPSALAVHANSVYIGDVEGVIWSWSPENNTWRELTRSKNDAVIFNLTITSDGSQLAAHTREGLNMWRIHDGLATRLEVPLSASLKGAVFSPNGDKLASINVLEKKAMIHHIEGDTLALSHLQSEQLVAAADTSKAKERDRHAPPLREGGLKRSEKKKSKKEKTNRDVAHKNSDMDAMLPPASERAASKERGSVKNKNEEASASDPLPPPSASNRRTSAGQKNANDDAALTQPDPPTGLGKLSNDEKSIEPLGAAGDRSRADGGDDDDDGNRAHDSHPRPGSEGPDPHKKTAPSDPETDSFINVGKPNAVRTSPVQVTSQEEYNDDPKEIDDELDEVDLQEGTNNESTSLAQATKQPNDTEQPSSGKRKPLDNKPQKLLDGDSSRRPDFGLQIGRGGGGFSESDSPSAGKPSPRANVRFKSQDMLASGPGITHIIDAERMHMACETLSSAMLRFSPDGQWLTTSFGCGASLNLWSVETGALHSVDIPDTERITDVLFTSTHAIVAASPGGPVLIDLAAISTRRLESDGFTATVLAISPDERWLVGATERGQVTLWDLSGVSPMRIFSAEAPHHIEQLTFSPDGQQIAATTSDHSAIIWDLTSGEARFLIGHREKVEAIAFLADGAVVTISEDRTARCWRDDVPKTPGELRSWLDQATVMTQLEGAELPPGG